MSAYQCCDCGSSEKDCRPYGPNAAMICFDCAMSTEERRETAEEMFTIQFIAAGPNPIVGAEEGPYPSCSLS